MYRFNNDYSQGAIPEILKALEDTNDTAYGGYGHDEWCDKATELIKKKLKNSSSDVHYLVGGTQANIVAIDSILRPYEGVICSDEGHIHVHECGAIEHVGHKILAVPHKNGKISAEQVEKIAKEYAESVVPEHVTVPRLVYISFSTEFGTTYSKKELYDIYKVCKKYKLYFFIDGARLAYGLAGTDCDVKFSDFGKLCDMFYIGATKCGALFGEALVINNSDLKPYFRNSMKQNGAILAKGWLLGLQLAVLFEKDRYFKIGEKAVAQAEVLRKAFAAKKIKEYIPNHTNQIFVVMDNKLVKKLSKNFVFEFEGNYDKDHTIVRFCTSWYTKDEAIEALIAAI